MNRTLSLAAVAGAVVLGLVAWVSRSGGGGADLSAQAASALTVEAVTSQVETWPETVQANGPITAWQEIVVSPETGGLALADMLVDVGDRVKRNQVLARLSDASLQVDLRRQEAKLAQARAQWEQAVSNVARARQVEGSGALSAQKAEDYRIQEATAQASLASAQAELDSVRLKLSQTRIVAADDGVVASKSGVLGSVVNAGAELYRLVRQGRLEWRAELDARQVDAVRPGQLARLTLPGGEQIQGKVRMVAPTLGGNTGRATVYVSLSASRSARAGMFASGTLELGQQPALTLPQSAIVTRDGRTYVYILGEGDKVSSQLVSLGRRWKDRVEVLDLEAPAQVVASGGAFLSEGVKVTVVAPKAAEVATPPGATATAPATGSDR